MIKNFRELKMTLTKIAELACTSVATVSKAFAGSREISEETKEKIFGIAKELGCFDKYYKAPRKQPLIAFMIPELDSECYGIYTSVFERAFSERGADTIVACTRFDAEKGERLFRELAYGMKVDGIIAWGDVRLIKNPDEIPFIMFADPTPESNADSVGIDLTVAITRLAKTIKEYGHTKVGFIGEKLTVAKEIRFMKAMRKIGLPIKKEYFYSSEKRFAEAGRDGMTHFIESGNIPTVIVTGYDQIAYGAMKYARDMGYKIPEDISFVGMDDISATSYFDVPLSSIYAGYEEICESVCDLMFKRIENRHYRLREPITVPVEVNIRESLRKIK